MYMTVLLGNISAGRSQKRLMTQVKTHRPADGNCTTYLKMKWPIPEAGGLGLPDHRLKSPLEQ